MKLHLRASECHLPYEITALTATRNKWKHPALTPARQAGTWFTYPGGMEGWVELDLGYQLHTGMLYPPTDSHPYKY